MIGQLDFLLRRLFLNQVHGMTDEAQIGFQPPDDAWRAHVSGLGEKNALNVYLFDLRENRSLRSNERQRTFVNGTVMEEPAPSRLDCHYLITAWSPAIVTESIEPAVDEHILLYRVTAVLTRSAPLNPSRIYPAGSAALASVHELIRDADLPTLVTPVEGFLKLAEFWGTMGANHRWKPAVYLIVSLPVVLTREEAGPMVTTLITDYRYTGRRETAEILIQIGGRVLDRTSPRPDGSPKPVSDAWVRLETRSGIALHTTHSDDDGKFVFTGLCAGQYQLNWRVTGYPAPSGPRLIDVPSPTGEYDLLFG